MAEWADNASPQSKIVIVDVCSNDGFVKDGLLIFQSKSTKDYHEEMDADR